MVHYKLTYFPMRGIGEIVRQLFELAHVEYEDCRIEREVWPELKHTAPFGQLPMLEVDGQKLPQSKAIMRYVAQKYGFAGADDWESAQIDSWADQYVDFLVELRPWFYIKFAGGEGDEAAVYRDTVEAKRDVLFPLFVRQLKENGSGFLVGKTITWVDLLLSTHLETFTSLKPDYIEKYPELQEFLKRVHAIPEIAAWIERRPKTDL
ncbi:unnamed protein product, partial [Mesorhabditis spiculigera]